MATQDPAMRDAVSSVLRGVLWVRTNPWSTLLVVALIAFAAAAMSNGAGSGEEVGAAAFVAAWFGLIGYGEERDRRREQLRSAAFEEGRAEGMRLAEERQEAREQTAAWARNPEAAALKADAYELLRARSRGEEVAPQEVLGAMRAAREKLEEGEAAC